MKKHIKPSQNAFLPLSDSEKVAISLEQLNDNLNLHSQLTKQRADLTAKNAEIETENATLRAENLYLIAQIEALKLQRLKATSEAPLANNMSEPKETDTEG